MQDADTFALVVGYHGAAFSGYARQPEQLTVQGELERALGLLFRRPVETVCAGRTDAGVHALGQVVSFSVEPSELSGRTLESLRRSLNALTHDDIVVREVRRCKSGFSARFDAQARTYRYFLATGATPPVLMRDCCWYVPANLDVEAMRRASRCLIGEHDFKSFCKAVSAEGKRTWRYVSDIAFDQEELMGQSFLVMTITGNAFLHSMVRSIMGTLTMVGRGQRDESWVAQALAACDRRAAGECAPAAGLVFWSVAYGDDAFCAGALPGEQGAD